MSEMRRRWLAIVLGVSVALNLFFVGLLSARAFQRSEVRHERPPYAGTAGNPRRFRQRSRPFDWMSEAEREQLRPRRKALRGLRHDVEEALTAEPFDREKLSHALSELRRETDGIQASVHEFMLQRAEGMNAEERRRLADSQWQPRDGR
jgi:uncharacterized membrane protein